MLAVAQLFYKQDTYKELLTNPEIHIKRIQLN